LVHTLVFTIPTGGGPAVISASSRQVRGIIFQNNGATNAIRVGGAELISTTGSVLAINGGALSIVMDSYFANLNEWFAYGTAGDVLSVLYIT
jgi:hypothetical protein